MQKGPDSSLLWLLAGSTWACVETARSTKYFNKCPSLFLIYYYILVKIANYPLLYWWMNSSNFRSMQLLKEWPWHRKFGKSLIWALLSFSSVSHIPYYINFRFNYGPNMSSNLACSLCQFVTLEACICLKNDHDIVNLVSHWYQLDCLLARSVIFRITSTSGLIMS